MSKTIGRKTFKRLSALLVCGILTVQMARADWLSWLACRDACLGAYNILLAACDTTRDLANEGAWRVFNRGIAACDDITVNAKLACDADETRSNGRAKTDNINKHIQCIQAWLATIARLYALPNQNDPALEAMRQAAADIQNACNGDGDKAELDAQKANGLVKAGCYLDADDANAQCAYDRATEYVDAQDVILAAHTLCGIGAETARTNCEAACGPFPGGS